MSSEIILSICLGIGLSASVGFRVFLPLFVLSLASYLGVIQLNETWIWIGNLTAVVIFGVATLVEVFAYFIPYIDNLLDSIAIPLAALAGTLVMVSTLAGLSPEVTWALAIIAGGGTAAAIAGSSGTTRLASTATTGGLGNPVIAFAETGTSVVLSVLSIVLPVFAFILVLFIIVVIFKVFKKFKKVKG